MWHPKFLGTPNSTGRAHASWQAKKTSVGRGAARTGWAGRTSDSGAWFSARLISPGFRANHSVEKCVCLNFTGLRKLGETVPWIWSRARRLLAVRMEMPSPSDGDASGACARGDTRSVHEPCVEPVHAQVLRELDGDLLRPALRRLARLDFHDAGAVVRLVVRRGDAVNGMASRVGSSLSNLRRHSPRPPGVFGPDLPGHGAAALRRTAPW